MTRYVYAYLVLRYKQICTLGFPLLFMILSVPLFLEEFAPLSDFSNLLMFALYSGGALLLGILIAVVATFFIPIPIISLLERKNGGPFQVGDDVCILIGPHRNKTAKIYSTWQHKTFRIDLGEHDSKKFNDIFSGEQLFKNKN